ncbi:MAG: amino acid ABC transporter substrate-binding protein [Thermoanaerobaculia bacterium]|nr:amino acid ABC transporter substrate-binding protein [Thermoanaerobaculia bacterium]
MPSGSRFSLIAALIALLPTVTAHAGEQPVDRSQTEVRSAGGSHVAAIKERGKLVMLCFPSMESAFSRPNLEHGPTHRIGTAEDFEGIDVELSAALARRLGVALEIRTLDTPGYGPLIPALVEGKVDLVASSLSITPERSAKVDFSVPYFSVYRAVVARKGSAIAAPSDLAGKKAAVIPGSSHHEILRRLDFDDANVYPVEFSAEYFTAVDDGEADFAVADSTTIDRNLKHFPRLEVAFRLPGEDHYGIAVPKGSDLLAELDALIEEAKASGELALIIGSELER